MNTSEYPRRISTILKRNPMIILEDILKYSYVIMEGSWGLSNIEACQQVKPQFHRKITLNYTKSNFKV